MKQMMSKHFVIRNGKLQPRVNDTIQYHNFHEITYTHNVRYLYSRDTYNSAQQYQRKMRQLEARLKDLKGHYSQQIHNLNCVIQGNQRHIYGQNQQLQHLKKMLKIYQFNLTQQSKNIHNLNSELNVDSAFFSSRYSPSITQRSTYNRSNNQGAGETCQQILQRVEKSQNTLKQLKDILEPYKKLIQQEQNRTKLKTENTTSVQQSDEVENDLLMKYMSIKGKQYNQLQLPLRNIQYSRHDPYQSKQYHKDNNYSHNMHKSQILRESKPVSQTQRFKVTRLYPNNNSQYNF